MENIQFLPPDDMQFEFVINMLSEGDQVDWGLISADIPHAHKYSKGKGIKVAVLDTGGSDHVDLNENIIGRYTVYNDGITNDLQGHSSHLSGIIAAAENGIGIIGVSPQASLIQIKVLSNSGTSGFAQIEAGIRMATSLGADLINMSLGCPVEPPVSLHEAIQEAYNKGIIIVAAAGNDAGSVNYPAKYSEVIAVAAVDENGNITKFSSHGSETHVGAPGVNIYSTYLNNQYAILNGTSQAAPFITGICALILSWSRSDKVNNIQIANGQDMLKLLDSLTDENGKFGFGGKEKSNGFGIPSFANFMPWK